MCYALKTMNEETIKIAIYPTGVLSDTYYFEIKPNGKLLVETGVRTDDNLARTPFIQRENPYLYINANAVYDYRSEKSRIEKYKYKEIYNLVNQIYQSNIPNTGEIIDNWNIQILYKGDTVLQTVYCNIPQVQWLVDELISVSPIEIYLRGLS